MASNPSFISAARIGKGKILTGNTSRTTSATLPTSGADIITGAAAGTRILEIVVQATNDPADSIVVLWLFDGTEYSVFDEIDIGNPSAASATTVGYRTRVLYDNLVLPSSSYKLAATITATSTGDVNVFALGGDLT
jgi:hypothetical protein